MKEIVPTEKAMELTLNRCVIEISSRDDRSEGKNSKYEMHN